MTSRRSFTAAARSPHARWCSERALRSHSDSRLKLNANAQRESLARFTAALRKLDGHLTDSAAPVEDVAAARKHARKEVDLISANGRLRATLAHVKAFKRARLRASDLPRKLRGDSYARQFIGKSLSKLLGSKKLAKAEHRLIAVLRQQPLLP